MSVRVSRVGEPAHRQGDVVVAGESLHAADRLEESAGSRHCPGGPALSPQAADPFLSTREARPPEVQGRHQRDVGQLEGVVEPLGEADTASREEEEQDQDQFPHVSQSQQTTEHPPRWSGIDHFSI